MTHEIYSDMPSVSLMRPRLASRRGPKTLRGKLHASENAIKYAFSRRRTKRDQDERLLHSIRVVLNGEQNDAFGALNLDAVALELLKAYRIRCEIEETTRQCVTACHELSDFKFAGRLKHLEGLHRYERRSRSRLNSLLMQYARGKRFKLSNIKRSILADYRRSS